MRTSAKDFAESILLTAMNSEIPRAIMRYEDCGYLEMAEPQWRKEVEQRLRGPNGQKYLESFSFAPPCDLDDWVFVAYPSLLEQ